MSLVVEGEEPGIDRLRSHTGTKWKGGQCREAGEDAQGVWTLERHRRVAGAASEDAAVESHGARVVIAGRTLSVLGPPEVSDAPMRSGGAAGRVRSSYVATGGTRDGIFVADDAGVLIGATRASGADRSSRATAADGHREWSLRYEPYQGPNSSRRVAGIVVRRDRPRPRSAWIPLLSIYSVPARPGFPFYGV